MDFQLGGRGTYMYPYRYLGHKKRKKFELFAASLRENLEEKSTLGCLWESNPVYVCMYL